MIDTDSPNMELVHEALEAITKMDLVRLHEALCAFPDKASRSAGHDLVMATCLGAVADKGNGYWPTDDDLAEFAERVTETEQWSRMEQSLVHILLRDGLAASDVFEGLLWLFSVVGNLLREAHVYDLWWLNYVRRATARVAQTRQEGTSA